MAYSRPTASNLKSPQKSQIVTSDNYELTFGMFGMTPVKLSVAV